MFLTNEYPLTFWSLLDARMESAIQLERRKIVELRAPVEASAATAELATRQVNSRRDELLLARMEVNDLVLLQMALRAQLANTELQVGIAALEHRRKTLEMLQSVETDVLQGLTSRAGAVGMLDAMVVNFKEARKGASTDTAQYERARLGTAAFTLPVLAIEEAADIVAASNMLATDLDLLHSQIQRLKIQTTMQFEIPERCVGAFAMFRVAFGDFPTEDVSSAAPAGAGTDGAPAAASGQPGVGGTD